ncbi:MAG: hypothetical protein HKO57_13380 [Akkermansiaceae bacterium]|nr:hypothetical protein [Akkermansiaceae bacterium]
MKGRPIGPLAALVSLPVVALAGGDPDGARNVAAASSLPEGAGLAAKAGGEGAVANHPAVIFADDFEAGEVGARWDETRNKETVLSLVDAGGGPAGKRSLRVEAHLGNDTGGGMTKWFKPAPVVFVRFYTRFDKDCDYVHHFVTLRANKSLQGGDRWSGFGGAGLKPAGDERFSTALEPWGDWGKNDPPGKWNFYSYWHEMSPAPDKKFWGNAFRPAAQPAIVKEKWICAEFMLKENTPGKRDGEQAFWIDGQLRGHWKGISWRTSPTLHANALTLESYVTDRWTKNPVNTVCFDNVVIAREYVGPVAE